MLRRQFLATVSKAVGRRVSPDTLKYAVKRGYVSTPRRRPDGYFDFDDRQCSELIDYIRSRSRIVTGDTGFTPASSIQPKEDRA